MPRRLGQHFLIRDSVLERLAVAACGEHTGRVIEIGAGRGALTRHLLPHTDELHALELDRQLAAFLREKFASEPKLTVHKTDVLAADLSQWGPAALAGNLPYYITSPIIEKFIRLDARFPTAVFLMQWEVAERLLAVPGTRSYGYLTVSTRLACRVELIARVPPAAFSPPPKVDSGAVLLRRENERPENLAELLAFASACFRQKRKTLRNNLRGFFGDRINDHPESSLRAEQLSVAQLIALYENLTRSVH